MATDAEIRWRLLKVFYDLRRSNGGWVPASEMNLAGMEPIDLASVGNVCQDLADAGLIEWKSAGDIRGIAAGLAKIKGRGVDVIEGKGQSSINLTPPAQEPPAPMKGEAGSFAQGPAFGGVSAKGAAGSFVPDTQTFDAAAAHIAADQRRTPVPQTDVTIPPTVPPIQSSQRVTVETSVTRATIPIVPTLYPGEPATGAIIVQNFITINTGSVEFREFTEKFGELIQELHQSNEIAGEVREKLVAEMKAGLEILQSPKPDPSLIDLFLKRPLAYIADKAGGAAIGTLASAALMALLKLIGVL